MGGKGSALHPGHAVFAAATVRHTDPSRLLRWLASFSDGGRRKRRRRWKKCGEEEEEGEGFTDISN